MCLRDALSFIPFNLSMVIYAAFPLICNMTSFRKKGLTFDLTPSVEGVSTGKIYLRPKVTLHCYYIYLFWVLVSGILNVFNSY